MVDFQNKVFIKLSKDKDCREKGVEKLLVQGETVIGSYSALRDYVVFTDKRIISVNVQGLVGKKKDFTSMPYSKITAFSVETAGVLDMDSELELYFSGLGKVKFEFAGNCDIEAIGKAISSYTLK